VHYRSQPAEAEASVRQIVDSGGRAIALGADVTDENSVSDLFQQTIDYFGRLDVVVANAGVGGGAPIVELDMEDFDRVISVNLRGAFLTVREAARRIENEGRIIFISSQLAHRPMANSGLYAASKAGMDAMVTAMSQELADRGITVNSVRPGATIPGMFASSDDERKERFRQMSPFKRLGQPEDIADIVSFVASSDARWITGQHLPADGGASN
jgi:3-oxoacyl-[acyl-carrier protein] reductase